MSMYKEFEKPTNLIEAEGYCPLCGTMMQESKSTVYNGKFYTFPFPIYYCISHYHGYFRWLGRKAHVRILFPGILRLGKVICETKAYNPAAEKDLIQLKCPDCRFFWEEVQIPHDKTWCPDCRKEITISRDAFTF